MTPYQRVRLIVLGLAASGVLAAPGVSIGQVPGRNVNMVSGTTYPGGDPFLRQQNEGTVASLTRNPCHLLAGGNDYRTVDLPAPPGIDEVIGDAWLGVFKSFDCGQRWQSTLLPGYPQDVTPEGLASPLKGFEAGADPVIAASHNGLAYYTGLVFDRDKSDSAVFVARFIDLNNKEGAFFEIESNADPIKYIDAHVVQRGNEDRFLDKPWVAADIPRPGAESVSLQVPVGDGETVTQSFACGHVYVSYSVFLEEAEKIHNKIYVARSTDCGRTWSRQLISEGSKVNQGTVIGIDPATGDVYVAWRRFEQKKEQDSILIASSTDGGRKFSKSSVVHTLNPPAFEQGTTPISFRTTAHPTLAVGDDGRVYLAWSERVGPAGEGRIVLTSSGDGGASWSAPMAVDSPPTRLGHQFMPALLFHQGRLAVLYYGHDLDHTRGVLECQSPDPDQCANTTDLVETKEALGHLDFPFEPGRVFNDCIAEVGFDDPSCDLAAGYDPLLRRHTLDVYLAMAEPGAAPDFGPPIRVSRYLFGQRDPLDPQAEFPPIIEQFEFNPPNLPMFLGGTVPFFSDYIFLTGAPRMLANPDGTWSFNDGPASASLLHAVWTDNRNVRPPPPGLTWADWVPPTSPDFPANRPSLFDPSQMVPNCDPTDPLSVIRTSMRNQDLYTVRISDGLLAGTLQNTKPLGVVPHPDPFLGGDVVIQRSFVVFVQNATPEIRHYRLGILGEPAGGTASWSQFDPNLKNLGVSIAPASSISRMAFVTSPDDAAASVTVAVTEITDPTDLLSDLPDGLQTQLVLNPDPTSPDIGNPDIGNPDIGNIANAEVYNPDIGNPDIGNPDIGNPDIGNPDIGNPDIGNPDIGNPDIGNPDIGNPDIGNPDVGNPDIGNPDIGNLDLASGSFVDATWTMANMGNTSAAYDLDLFRTSAVPGGVETQLIVHKVYTTPTSVGCELEEETHTVVVANITDPGFVADPADVGVTDPTNPDIGNATVALAPLEEAKVTLRFLVPDALVPPGSTANDFVQEIVEEISPVAVSQSVNTVDALAGKSQPPFALPLTILSQDLKDGYVGTIYSDAVAIGGGVAPYTFSVIAGALPPGLALDPGTGAISGIPTTPGTFGFTVEVEDFEGDIDSQSLSIKVNLATVTFVVQPSNTSVGQAIAPAITVRVEDATATPQGGVTVDLTLDADPSGAALGGTVSAVTNPSGIASFAGLTLDQGGLGFTLEAAADLAGTLAIGRSDPFNVVGFSQPGSLSTDRVDHTVTRLRDGRVLLAGGASGPSTLATAEIFDPATDSAVSTGSMSTVRRHHTAALLPDGTVLIAGGQTGPGVATVLATAEIFDPDSGSFSAAANLAGTRTLHTATALTDGTVLLAGGQDDLGTHLATAEIYDPATGVFSAAGSLSAARSLHTATRLVDGRVLVTGGLGAADRLDSAEIYDPAAGTWSVTGSMTADRARHAAARLIDGRVLVGGGDDDTNTPQDTAELYDPSAGTFSSTAGTMSTAFTFGAITALGDGQALVSGGFTDVPLGPVATVDLFDPTSDTFTATAPLSTPRHLHTATLLLDGRVLAAGGSGVAGVELYHPDSPFSPFARIIPSDSDAGDRFSIQGMSGETAIGGAPLNDDACPADLNCDSGSAYIFERNAGGPNRWGEITKITAPDAADGDRFAIRTAFQGDTLAVAAVQDDDSCPADPDCDSGSVYIFERDQGGSDNWGLVKKITASDQQAGAFFGSVMGLDGDTLVVGASGVNQAYVYERNAGGADNWGEVAILSPPDLTPGIDGLGSGFSIGLEGDTLAIDNAFDSDVCTLFPGCANGSVYIFERNLGGPDNWGQVTEIHADDADDLDLFGVDLSLSGDTLAVGAFFDDDACPSDRQCNSGSAYVFERDAGGPDNWGQVKKVTPSDAKRLDRFGLLLSVQGNALAVFNLGPAGEPGAFYLFGRNQGGAGNWGQLARVTASGATENFGAPRLAGSFLIVGNSQADAACPGNPNCDSGVAHIYFMPPF